MYLAFPRFRTKGSGGHKSTSQGPFGHLPFGSTAAFVPTSPFSRRSRNDAVCLFPGQLVVVAEADKPESFGTMQGGRMSL